MGIFLKLSLALTLRLIIHKCPIYVGFYALFAEVIIKRILVKLRLIGACFVVTDKSLSFLDFFPGLLIQLVFVCFV